MKMSPRIPHLAVFSLVAVHLLLFSICPVSSRIYRTNDAVVIEVDDVRPPLSPFAIRNFGNPLPIPIMYEVNPCNGLNYQRKSNFPFWPYPLYTPTSSFSDVENVTAISADSRQQKIACGVGPASPPHHSFPEVGIVGGTEAAPNSWPFVVGLRKLGSNVFCGGSIISPTRILSAAHCFIKLSAFDIFTMTVSLGMHTQGNLPNTFNDAQVTRRVTRVVYHTNYNDKTKYFDVAVLTVDPPIVYSAAISPVCLPPPSPAADQFVDHLAVFMGWGTTKSGGDQPNALQQASVVVVWNDECNRQYGNMQDQQICASADLSAYFHGKDACQGDSGGPLVVQANRGSMAWTQVGVTSFGNDCADPKNLGVYSSVAFFRNWINNYMKN